MGILDFINSAMLGTAAYTPTKPYTGKLPTKVVRKGSKGASVKAVQNFLNWCINAGLVVDGIAGTNTVKAIKKYQKKYGLKKDGIFGGKCLAKAKKIVAKYEPKPTPTPTPTPIDPLQPWYDALKTQYDWSKNQKYHWNDKPTVANTKKEGTCISYVAVALQRLGLLPKGKYFYLYPKTNKIAGTGAKYAKEHTEIYEISYPNKTVAQLWKEGKIKKGDIVGYDNPNYHTMVFMGKNSKGEFIYDTMGAGKRGVKVKYPYYTKRKIAMLVRLKKVR